MASSTEEQTIHSQDRSYEMTYLNVTLTGKVLRWKLYLQDKDFHLCNVPRKEVHQGVPNKSQKRNKEGPDPVSPTTKAAPIKRGV